MKLLKLLLIATFVLVSSNRDIHSAVYGGHLKGLGPALRSPYKTTLQLITGVPYEHLGYRSE
jgi:hypothetical protein